jgi:hypothetical protein
VARLLVDNVDGKVEFPVLLWRSTSFSGRVARQELLILLSIHTQNQQHRFLTREKAETAISKF